MERTSIQTGLNDKAPKKVNIDVLKKRVYQQEKKEKFQGKVIIFCLFLLFMFRTNSHCG